VTRYRGLDPISFEHSDLTPYGTEGLYVMNRYAVAVDDPACPVLVELEVAMIEGQPECVELRCQPRTGQLVTSEMLRKVPLRRYLRESANVYSVRVTTQHEVEVIATTGPGDEPLMTRAAQNRRRRQITDEFLRDVAAAYERAGTKPTLAVMHQFHGSRATASRWVREARNRGFLPEQATEEER
jgi:hypothetical protein